MKAKKSAPKKPAPKKPQNLSSARRGETRGKHTWLRLSEAHVNYLEHQLCKPLGSFGAEEIRGALGLLFKGKLPAHKPGSQYNQSGQAFTVYNQPRRRIEMLLTAADRKKLQEAEPTSISRAGSIPLEFLIDCHAAPLGYYIENHKCSPPWCSADGADPCPGMVFAAKAKPGKPKARKTRKAA